MKSKSLLAGLVLAGAFTSAHALSVFVGNDPQPDQSNLLFNTCGAAVGSGSGNPVFGCLNDDNTKLVRITSNESLEITGGQASLDATDGTLSAFTISPGSAFSFSSLIFDIDATEDGFVNFTDASGTSAYFAVDDNGENFFTLTGILGDFVTVTSVNSQLLGADIITDVKQIRLGVVGAIPEPETYALMMAGLAALGFVARRRKLRS